MSKGMYEIVQVGVSRRYVVYLKDESGNVVLTSQYRELKPMCLNEISWMRNAGLKDSLYEFIDADDGGLLFNVRATDAHVLGTSPVFRSEEERMRCAEEVKRLAADAEVIDRTPEIDLTTRIHDVLQTPAREVVARAVNTPV